MEAPDPAATPQVATPQMATPCIKVCIVDGESGLCMGCHRTLREVASWTTLTDAARAEIMAALPARRDQIRPEKLAMFR